MTLLNRDAILGAQDVQTKDVPVAAWGGSIRVRTMTVAERSAFAAKAGNNDSQASIGAWLVALLAIDEHGKPLFKPEDIPSLEGRNHRAMDEVTNAILAVNGMGEKEVKAAEKN